jgi:hypothetical protein
MVPEPSGLKQTLEAITREESLLFITFRGFIIEILIEDLPRGTISVL